LEADREREPDLQPPTNILQTHDFPRPQTVRILTELNATPAKTFQTASMTFGR
jgi:hypothetical protein